MRLLFTSLACLLFFPGLLLARIGETLDECATRYGPLIEKRPAEFSGSDPELAVFSKSAVTILVEFRQGKAWHITFRKPTLTTLEIEALLEGDAGDGVWGSSLKVLEREYRQSADRQRLAVLNVAKSSSTSTTLQIMAREYVTQVHAMVVERFKNPEAIEALKKKSNPLPGF